MNNNYYHKLIALLAKKKIDYFIIPATDEYGFEFTPEYNNRLYYFTEFTGSAGTAVICCNGKSLFFTDGRYLTQAAQELNPTNFIVKDITKESVGQWLQNNIADHETFGYCPELHTSHSIKLLRLNAGKCPIEITLIDQLLTNKPEKPLTNITSYQINFAGQGSAAKRDAIFKALKIQCPVLITEPALVCWALNLRGSDLPTTPVAMCHVILYPNGTADLFANKHQICFDATRKKIKIFDIAQLPRHLSQFELEQHCMAVDQSIATAATIDQFKQNKIKIIDINNTDIWQIAIVKSQREIDLACGMHIYDGVAVTKLLAWIKQNFARHVISEQQAAQKLLHYRMMNKDFISPSFPTISAYGPNSAIIHYSGWNNAVLKHGLYLVDSGGQYLGATTDATRTIALGAPTLLQQTQYTLVLKGMLTLAKQQFPTGTMAHQLDSIARQHLWQQGYDYPHGTGHGVGNFLNVHEPPNISSRPSKFAIKPHIIVSNEPGVYFPEKYGIRIENLMYSKMQSDRFLSFVQLTCIPFDYDLILPAMLSALEKEWLNQYNSWLKHSLTAHLTQEERIFLQQHTAPL